MISDLHTYAYSQIEWCPLTCGQSTGNSSSGKSGGNRGIDCQGIVLSSKVCLSVCRVMYGVRYIALQG